MRFAILSLGKPCRYVSNGGNTFTQGTPQNGNTYHHSSGIIQVLATNIQTGYDRVMITNRKGEFLVTALHFLAGKVAQPPTVYTHIHKVYGDQSSLSDERLKQTKFGVTITSLGCVG